MARKARKFKYVKRDESAIKARAQKTSSKYARLTKDPVNMHKWEEREYKVRFLPPTWEGAEHFGLDVWYHRNVGPDGDGDKYLSRSRHGLDGDAIRDYVLELKSEGKKKEAKKIEVSDRVFYFGIDRDNEGLGVQIFDMPQTADKEMAKVCKDRRTGQSIDIDDPEEGNDVFFTREKDGGFPVNKRFELDATSSIYDEDKKFDEAMDFIEAHPIPDYLNIMENSELQVIIQAMKDSNPTERAEDDDTTPAPRTRSRAQRPEPEPERELKPDLSGRTRRRPEPIDDEDADLDEPEPQAGGLRKRSRTRREPLPDYTPEVDEDDIPF